MDLLGRAKPQMVGVRADNFSDSEGAKSFVVQLLGRSGSLDILGRQPSEVAYGEAGLGGAKGVGMLFLTVLVVTHFGSKVVVDLLHTGGEVAGGSGVLNCRGSGGEKVQAGVKPLISEER